MLIWCALVVLLSINSSSSLNIPQSPPESRHYRLTTSLSSTSSGALLDEGQFFYLPIFPFRKSVTVPTGQVNLNLFEPRYLSLFNDVLSASNVTFGAIHSSSTSYEHVLIPSPDSNLPDMIVPKIPAGAVGTLCETTSHKSSKSRDGSRKMLRVQGRGVERFKVEEIVSNGYDYFYGKGGRQQKPYIICRGSLYSDDDPVSLHDEMDIKNTELSLYRSIKELEEVVDSMWDCQNEESMDECYLSVHRFAPESEEDEEDVRGLLERTFATSSSECAGEDECMMPQSSRSTLFSMAVANSLADEHFSTEDMLELLETKDVKDRLKRCEDVIRGSKKWIETRRMLKDLF